MKLREYLDEKCINMKMLGDRIPNARIEGCVDRSRICRMIAGELHWYPHQISALAKVLGINYDRANAMIKESKK